MRPRLIYPSWPVPTTVKSVSTTRIGGHSPAPFDSFNLGFGNGDDRHYVDANRRTLRNELDLEHEPLWLSQVHGNECVDAATALPGIPADAAISSQARRACAIMTADCLPVLLCDRDGTRVGAAHAGWRGLAAGVIENTVARLDCAPQSVLAWLGPCIGPQAYEIDAQVYDAFVNAYPQDDAHFAATRAGHWNADLHGLATARLGRLGIDAVYPASLCTATDTQTFFSYRRDGPTGRMASLIWIA